jgi:hypothetical protein
VAFAAAAASCLLAAGGCATDPPAPAEAAPRFDAAAAATVLGGFDTADSAASTSGDEKGLRAHEVEPALLFSVAAVRSARAHGRKQPTFQHVNPAFAIPSDGSCFLTVATLRLAGEELDRRDVSVFVREGDGAWRLSHNVLLGQETPPAAVAVDAEGLAGPHAIPAGRQETLARELFARGTGKTSPDDAVAPVPLLDQRLAGGWTIYQQQLAAAGLSATRRLDGFATSACAARVAGETLLFLTLKLTDTVTAAKGKSTLATLPPDSPDAVALGLDKGLRGRTLTVVRTEVFLLSVSAGDAGRATVLGVGDVATTASVTG